MSAAAIALAGERPEQPGGLARRGRFISLRLKLLLAFGLLFSLAFAGAFLWFYSLATDDAMSSIQESLTYTINGAVDGINGDEFQALVAEGQRRPDGLTNDPRYWSELAWFKKVHDLDPRAYPYSYIPGPDKNGKQTNYFIVDYLQIADPSRAAGFKEQWTLNSGTSRGGFQTLTYLLTPYTDKWGSWVSAYAPIKNSRGQVVGALGVDFRADYVYQVQRDVLYRVLPALAVAEILLLVLVFLLSRTLTEPIRTLTRAARRVADGNYDSDFAAMRGAAVKDEIGTLAEVFQIMVAKVSHREQTLVQRVEQLTIEIDEAKRQNEVGQIVQSDFFQDLQSRAMAMRQRRRAPSGPDAAPDLAPGDA